MEHSVGARILWYNCVLCKFDTERVKYVDVQLEARVHADLYCTDVCFMLTQDDGTKCVDVQLRFTTLVSRKRAKEKVK